MSADRDPRRRFNGTERAALYLAADGRCQACGVELEPGWHGDHVTAHSRSGPTDVINGQALCPPCNLHKGASMPHDLRAWQSQARTAFYASNARDFLVSATPGAGKTQLALTVARELVARGTVARIVIIVPTDALRQQWTEKATAAGLDLMPVSDPADWDKAGYVGCVATYQQVASGAGAELLRRTTRATTFAVLDEIHHAGDQRSWGLALERALEYATHRLCLTGTPWRNDRDSPIPFVRYDHAGKVVVDYAYEYGAAVADGVCRQIDFHSYNGDAQWVDCGKVVSAELGPELAQEDVSVALEAVLDPKHSWMPALLRQACSALAEVRAEMPDAGGLVVAHSQTRAYEYALEIEKITGAAPVVAVSDDQEAKQRIDEFRDGTQPWLVAVKMVSEGVDIPRLAVGVYASKTRTPLFFRQVVGRFVRVRSDEEINARLYIPAVPALTALAMEIEDELRHQLELESERDEKTRAEAEAGQRSFELREPLSASEATFDSAIFGGAQTSPEIRAAAEQWCRSRGIPTMYAPNVVADVLAEANAATVTVTPKPPTESRHKREQMLRKEITTLVGKVAHRACMEPQEINTELLRRGFPKRAEAALDDLILTRDELAKWLGAL